MSETNDWVFRRHPGGRDRHARRPRQGGTTLRPYLGVGVSLHQRQRLDGRVALPRADAAAGTFTSTIDNPGTLGVVRAGVEVMSSDHFDATLHYNGGFGDGYTANAGAIKLTWRF